jgi:hypothetical protein
VGFGRAGSLSGDGRLGVGLDGVDFVRSLGGGVGVVGVLDLGVAVDGTTSLLGDLPGVRDLGDCGIRDMGIGKTSGDIRRYGKGHVRFKVFHVT